jgi:hypothetical protein
MIYTTFKSVEDDYFYALKLLAGAAERAEDYIIDVLHEVGTIEINFGDTPIVIALKGKRYEEGESIAFYKNVAEPLDVDNFSTQELYEICKEIRSMRLVEEYGDENENPE